MSPFLSLTMSHVVPTLLRHLHGDGSYRLPDITRGPFLTLGVAVRDFYITVQGK